MEKNDWTAARLISERTDRTWIPGCPVAVKKTRVTEKDGVRYVTVTAAPCGAFDVVGYTADVAFSGRDRQPVGVSENVPLTIGESAEIPIPFDGAC